MWRTNQHFRGDDREWRQAQGGNSSFDVGEGVMQINGFTMPSWRRECLASGKIHVVYDPCISSVPGGGLFAVLAIQDHRAKCIVFRSEPFLSRLVSEVRCKREPMTMPRELTFERILVIKLRLIGDVLLSTPVFAALRERFPKAHIAACVSAGTGGILDGDPNVTEIISGTVGARESGKVGKELGIARKIRRGRFDLVLDLTTSDRSAILTRLSGARRRIGYTSHKGFWGRSASYTSRVAAVRDEHMVLKHCRILEPLGIRVESPKLVFPVSVENRAAVANLLPEGKAFFQVHPVSRIAKKNWPLTFFAETVNAIAAARGWVPVITGSNDPQEKAEIVSLKKMLRGQMVDLSGRVSLKELGAVSERAKFFLGVDTAPMHIAAAVGAPVAAFFGPSSEQLWAPWCEKKLVLSREELDCRLPCKNKHGCQTIHCLREFTPEVVWPRVEKFLNGL